MSTPDAREALDVLMDGGYGPANEGRAAIVIEAALTRLDAWEAMRALDGDLMHVLNAVRNEWPKTHETAEAGQRILAFLDCGK